MGTANSAASVRLGKGAPLRTFVHPPRSYLNGCRRDRHRHDLPARPCGIPRAPARPPEAKAQVGAIGHIMRESPSPRGPQQRDLEETTLPTISDSALPPQGILLHIGPHKTGTTALQAALVASSEQLAEVGVLVPDSLLLYRGATALTGWTRGDMEPDEEPPVRDWQRLDEWVRQHTEAKLALSSEWFDDCTPDMITTIRDSWGADRLRVLVTIRSLERLLPSTWQQAVKTGAKYSYANFLKPLLAGPHAPPTKRATHFWYRLDDAALVQRWADVVGVDKVVVVIADEREPDRLYRHAEALLGATEGTISPAGISNRSLTMPEIVAVRAMYKEVLPADNARQLHSGCNEVLSGIWSRPASLRRTNRGCEPRRRPSAGSARSTRRSLSVWPPQACRSWAMSARWSPTTPCPKTPCPPTLSWSIPRSPPFWSPGCIGQLPSTWPSWSGRPTVQSGPAPAGGLSNCAGDGFRRRSIGTGQSEPPYRVRIERFSDPYRSWSRAFSSSLNRCGRWPEALLKCSWRNSRA